MVQNVILQGHDLERSRSYFKTNGTIRLFDLKNIDLEAKLIVLSALVQKLWSKTSFCIMVANIMNLLTSHIQIAQDNFYLLKGPDPSYPLLKFGDYLSNSN